MALSRRSRPKHSMLMQQLLTLVQEIRDRGETCLPSERELGEQFGVSRVTVRNALAELEEQGQIYRVQGKGAFVSTEKFHHPLSSLTSFTQDMDSQGMVSGARILALETIPAPRMVAKLLRISEDSQVLLLRRLRSINAEPIAIENCYLPPPGSGTATPFPSGQFPVCPAAEALRPYPCVGRAVLRGGKPVPLGAESLRRKSTPLCHVHHPSDF